MSQRIEVAIKATNDEWDSMCAPFQRLGAKDPVIAELRATLHANDPEWISGKGVRDVSIERERLEEISRAAQTRADLLEQLPEGEERDKAKEVALAAARVAEKLIAELNVSPSPVGQHHDSMAV